VAASKSPPLFHLHLRPLTLSRSSRLHRDANLFAFRLVSFLTGPSFSSNRPSFGFLVLDCSFCRSPPFCLAIFFRGVHFMRPRWFFLALLFTFTKGRLWPFLPPSPFVDVFRERIFPLRRWAFPAGHLILWGFPQIPFLFLLRGPGPLSTSLFGAGGSAQFFPFFHIPLPVAFKFPCET